jgi:hypothetical protein
LKRFRQATLIHTNNLACHQKKEFILLNSEKMNDKYRFSKFLTGLFLTQDFIPSCIQQCYFERIRSLSLQQYEAISSRKKKEAIDNKKSNRKMKTFFRCNPRYQNNHVIRRIITRRMNDTLNGTGINI